MQNLIITQTTDTAIIELNRRKYLESLPFFQELYLEFFVRKGDYYSFKVNDFNTGYFIIKDCVLHEYYSDIDDIFQNKEVLSDVIKRFRIVSAHCKSFDHKLLNSLNLISPRFNVVGIHFRKYLEQCYTIDNSISERLADLSDFAALILINDNLFENDAEIRYCLEHKGIILFENEDKILLGCGLILHIAYDYKYRDIGMLVNPAFRKQGYGTYIINRLVSLCKERNYIPICGCAANNTASYFTLKKAGFIPEHELLSYSFDCP